MDHVEALKQEAVLLADLRTALLRALPGVVSEVRAMADRHGIDGAGSLLASLLTTVSMDVAAQMGWPPEQFTRAVADLARAPAAITSRETILLPGGA